MTDPTTTPNMDFRTHLVAVDRHTEQLLTTARSLDPGSIAATPASAPAGPADTSSPTSLATPTRSSG